MIDVFPYPHSLHDVDDGDLIANSLVITDQSRWAIVALTFIVLTTRCVIHVATEQFLKSNNEMVDSLYKRINFIDI